MSLATRIRTADPLSGELPDALPAPALPHDDVQVSFGAPRRRRARAAIVVVVAAACLVAAIAVVRFATADHGPERVRATFTATSVSARTPSPGAIQRSVDILRRRLDATGTGRWSVAASAPDTVRATCSGCDSRRDLAVASNAARPGRLLLYDWEANVLDERCRPVPTASDVTGGPEAGVPGTGSSTTYYAAVLRAAGCAERHYPRMSHASPVYYAVDRVRGRVLSGPEASASAALAAAGPSGGNPDGGPSRVVRVAPGTTVVEAAYPDGSRPAPNAAQWFVLRDRLALDGHDVTDPRTGADPTGRPVVTLRFTPAGGQRWRETTRRLAQRGIALTIPGAAPKDDFQHFAVVLDDRLLTVPFVDDRLSPDGLDPRAGLQLEGEFTARGARALAALLRTGVLPVQLAPAKPGTP